VLAEANATSYSISHNLLIAALTKNGFDHMLISELIRCRGPGPLFGDALQVDRESGSRPQPQVGVPGGPAAGARDQPHLLMEQPCRFCKRLQQINMSFNAPNT
jgi:hypothetical protein